MPTPKLHPTAQSVYDAVRAGIQRNGYSPSIREIMAETGISSTSVVAYNIDALQEAGLVHRAPNRARSLTLPEPKVTGLVVRRITQSIGTDEGLHTCRLKVEFQRGQNVAMRAFSATGYTAKMAQDKAAGAFLAWLADEVGAVQS